MDANKIYEKMVSAGRRRAIKSARYETLSEYRKALHSVLYREFRNTQDMSVSDSEHAARAHPRYLKLLKVMNRAHRHKIDSEVLYFAVTKLADLRQTEAMKEMNEAKIGGKVT